MCEPGLEPRPGRAGARNYRAEPATGLAGFSRAGARAEPDRARAEPSPGSSRAWCRARLDTGLGVFSRARLELSPTGLAPSRAWYRARLVLPSPSSSRAWCRARLGTGLGVFGRAGARAPARLSRGPSPGSGYIYQQYYLGGSKKVDFLKLVR